MPVVHRVRVSGLLLTLDRSHDCLTMTFMVWAQWQDANVGLPWPTSSTSWIYRPPCFRNAALKLHLTSIFSGHVAVFFASLMRDLAVHDNQRSRRYTSVDILQTMLTVHSRHHFVQIILFVAPTPPRHGSVSSALVLPNNLLHTTPQIILKHRDLVQIDSLHTGTDPVLRVTTLRIYW
jgi:hypothetical protein